MANQNWNYSFNNGYSFTITTSDTPDVSGYFSILALSGTDSIGTPLNLTLEGFGGFGFNDNLISNQPGFFQGVDGNGVTFSDGTRLYNLYSSYWSQITTIITNDFDPSFNFANFSTACFLPGTLIRTTEGDLAVEALKIGDLVPTLSGEVVPVKWVGYQRFNGRFIPLEKSTVCFKAGSLGAAIPERDLYVTAAHAMVVNNTLVNAAQLVNGITITQAQSQDMVEVYHVDLGEHHCLLAEGTWAESYREAKNRHTFNNSQDYLAVYPEASLECEQEACLPHVHDFNDERLPGLVKTVLNQFPEDAFSDTPDLHLIVDGVKIEANQVNEDGFSFLVPAGAKTMRLISHATPPLSIGESIDQRRLGFAVHELIYATLDGTSHYHVAPHSSLLNEGFHEAEGEERRWTNGNALLPKSPLAEETLLTIKGRALARYLVSPAQATQASHDEAERQATPGMRIVGTRH